MPDFDITVRRAKGKTDRKIAFLYQLTFPDGLIYIGCTTQDPLQRLLEHKRSISRTQKGIEYSLVSFQINKYNDLRIKTLAVGEENYMMRLEADAIDRFNAITRGHNVMAGPYTSLSKFPTSIKEGWNYKHSKAAKKP